MISMYIDESGSIHPTSEMLNRYFIIGIVIPKDSIKLKKVYKKSPIINKNNENNRQRQRMVKNGK